MAALGTLAAGIAHDLNNILAMLRGYLSLARVSLGPQHPAQTELGEAEKAAARATSLANRILSFSRPQETRFRSTSVEEAVRESLWLLRACLPPRIGIVSDFVANLPSVWGDTAQIQQVLVNLGINAAQAMTDGAGVIRVSLAAAHVEADSIPGAAGLEPGEYVWLRFSDTGCGMDTATCERIFDPFFTTKPRGIGTGLGLSVVREIIAEHGGSITVRSKPGEGTEFSIYLPAAGPKAAEAAVGPLSAVGRGQRILFLDDDAGFVELAKRLIEKAGYRVIAHSNPADALAAFSAAPQAFDLVVADLEMPGETGLDIAQRLLPLRADIPIIITAGDVSPVEAARAAACGVREVVSKSATVHELCVAFARALRPPH